MTEAELHKYATQFLQNYYHLSLDIPIKRNNRLRTTYGRYVMTKSGQPLRIEIAGKTIEYGTTDVILGILKHECIHYALHMKGLTTKDGDPYFENELKKYGAPSTNTIVLGVYYKYRCKKCEKVYETTTKQVVKTPNKYRTTCCRSTFTVQGESIYNGETKFK